MLNSEVLRLISWDHYKDQSSTGFVNIIKCISQELFIKKIFFEKKNMAETLILSHLALFFQLLVQEAIGIKRRKWGSQPFKPTARQRFLGNNRLPNRKGIRIVCFAPAKCWTNKHWTPCASSILTELDEIPRNLMSSSRYYHMAQSEVQEFSNAVME